MCRNSFGPCALECGPSTPVIRNCALGKLLAEHRHERDRAALAHVRRRLAEVALRRLRRARARATARVGGAFQPVAAVRRLEASRSRRRADRPRAAASAPARRASPSTRRRQAQRELQRRLRAAARCRRSRAAGRPSAPVTASAGRQVRLRISSADRSSSIGCDAAPANGNLRQTSSPRTCAAPARLRDALGGNRRRGSRSAGPRRCARPRGGRAAGAAMRKRRRHDAAARRRSARPRSSTSTRELAADEAAQRRRAPTAGRSCRSPSRGRRRATASPMRGGERIDVGRQVVAAALLARLDQHRRSARAATPCALQRLDRGERGEDRVAVVGAAAAVEPVVLDHRRPRPEALAPAGHLRLLVEVAVEQHGRRRSPVAGHVDEDHRRAALEAHDLERQARRSRLRAHPARP